MKNKRLLILLVAGMIILIIGMVFKIMYWQGYTLLLIIGMLGTVIALGKLVIRSLTTPSQTKEDRYPNNKGL